MHCSNKRAFTLVELLVVIGIIGVLMAIVLPALQSSREQVRRAVCGDKLKRLAEATAIHHANKHRLPGFQEVLNGRIVSWPVVLMPQIGNLPIYDGWAKLKPGPVPSDVMPYRAEFYCPSAPSPDLDFAQSTYVANAGFGPRLAGVNADRTDPGTLSAGVIKGRRVNGSRNDYWDFRDKANGPFVDRVTPASFPRTARNVTLGDFKDGVSNTVLFSENLQAGHWSATMPGQTLPDAGAAPWGTFLPPLPDTHAGDAQRPPVMVWVYAHNPGVPISDPPALRPEAPPEHAKINGGLRQVPTTLNVEWYRPSSDHPGGVMMAFADGHTDFISEDIAYHTYIQRLTCDRKKSIMPHPDSP